MPYDYILIKNRLQILLGPINWRPRFIQSELEEIGIDYTISMTENGYTNISQELGLESQIQLELIPIEQVINPEFNVNFDELVGPTYLIDDETKFATQVFTKKPLPLESVKGKLKEVVSSIRYQKEIAGVNVSIGDETLHISTDRDSRLKFTNLALSNDVESINYKVGNKFIQLTSTDIQSIINSINSYIQEQFNWEKLQYDAIDSCTRLSELKFLKFD